MNIAVVGSSSTHDESFKFRNLDLFAPFCTKLGAWIGAKGHRLLVESDSSGTADALVAEAVAGVIATSGNEAGASVKVFWRRGKAHRSPFPKTAAPSVFVEEPVSDALLGATHHKIMREADALIAIGGGRNTYNAALTAAFTRTRLIPVGIFGGAGRQLLAARQDLRHGALARLPDDSVLDQLGSASIDTAFDAVASELEQYPRVMIVHGRDEDRQVVKDLLSRECEVKSVTILAEQPRLGGHVLQEFQNRARSSDAAVVLFTPNDFATPTLDADGRPLAGQLGRLRARQNVVLEYGWFWGALGRDRILVLVKGDIELPSDLNGLLYYPYSDTPAEQLDALKLLVAHAHHKPIGM
jgi:predicted nucleotide-binding protein